MNPSKNTAILVLLAAILSGCAPSESAAPQAEKDARPSISEIVTNYTSFQEITKGAVFVNPEFAMLCIGVSQGAVEAARKEFGPHANAAINVYMNDLAAGAFRTNAASYAVGAVIVKQKAMLSFTDKDGKNVKTPEHGVGGMVKRSAGYDPKHGDWEYFYFDDPARVESGRISSCVRCHESAKDKDYVFGSWSKKGG